MDKAPDAFRTISEVAEEINVPQHVLRFWESRFAQIRPMKRAGGRRYYRPDDVDLLRGIRHLLYGEGYTIRGVQRILREGGVVVVQNVWRPGAEPPPATEDDSGAADRAEEAAGVDIRSPDRDERPAHEYPDGRHGPTVMPPPAAERARRAAAATSEQRGKLQAVLAELIACRSRIDAALADDFSDGAVDRSGGAAP